MCSKVVAGPDLSDPLMWFLLAICANGAWNPIAPAPDRAAVRPAPVRPPTETLTPALPA